VAKTAPPVPISSLLIHKVAKYVKQLSQAKRVYLVGSRSRHKYGRDLDLVVTVEDPALRGRNVTFKVVSAPPGTLSVNLFFALFGEEEPAILEYGLGADNRRWKAKAKAVGLRLNRYGLWRGKNLITNGMAEIARILDMPLKAHLVWSLEHPL
jgi:DNA polymerase/3'-5' exonuclease PolX